MFSQVYFIYEHYVKYSQNRNMFCQVLQGNTFVCDA